ncbi:hypothetical protein PENTCL1PPCAC_18048, partial [Pristionchus entomophagus]
PSSIQHPHRIIRPSNKRPSRPYVKPYIPADEDKESTRSPYHFPPPSTSTSQQEALAKVYGKIPAFAPNMKKEQERRVKSSPVSTSESSSITSPEASSISSSESTSSSSSISESSSSSTTTAITAESASSSTTKTSPSSSISESASSASSASASSVSTSSSPS